MIDFGGGIFLLALSAVLLYCLIGGIVDTACRYREAGGECTHPEFERDGDQLTCVECGEPAFLDSPGDAPVNRSGPD